MAETKDKKDKKRKISVLNHYYFHSRKEKALSRPIRLVSRSIMVRVWRESQMERVDRVDNWKKGRCHRQPFTHVYRIRLIKGLFGPFAKNSTVTIATFMNAYVGPNEHERHVAN